MFFFFPSTLIDLFCECGEISVFSDLVTLMVLMKDASIGQLSRR